MADEGKEAARRRLKNKKQMGSETNGVRVDITFLKDS
jgi:hypothetical protein